MIGMKRTLRGIVFTAVLALSLVATSVPAFAAQSRGDTSAQITRTPPRPPKQAPVVGANVSRQGVTWEGVTWEGVAWSGISWE